jgi:adenylylsulfate kinase
VNQIAGGIVWLTGLSGAGKTTLARAVLVAIGDTTATELLDGDEMRALLSRGLGFSREDRNTNVQRIGYVARMLAKHGVLVVVAAIAPYADARGELGALSAAAGHTFLEVFVHAPLEIVIERDVKGLYRRALAGEIKNFTGIDDPYEAPSAPALTVHTHQQSLDACVADVLALLRRERLIPD